MKRCPECRRDYYDDSLSYCLDDGSALVEGPASGNAPTVLFSERDLRKRENRPTTLLLVRALIGIIGIVLIVGGGYWLLSRSWRGKSGASPAVYDNYIRAKVLVSKENRDDVDDAIKLMQQTVSDDPQYAAAWATLAHAYHIKAFYFATAADERKQLSENEEIAVERSLAIDPDLAEGHYARGLMLWTHAKRFPHERAIQSFKRALAIDPNLDDAHQQLGLIYMHLGLFDKALAELGKALEINPANTSARLRTGVVYLYRGKYEDAYSVFSSTPLQQNPSLLAFQTATALFELGRDDEASALIEKYLTEYPNDEGGVGTSVKAMILAKAGRTADAEAAITHAEEIGPDFGHFHHTAYNIASAYALMKKPDKAVDYLQIAADDGFPCYPLFENDEVFKHMRDNTRFVAG